MRISLQSPAPCKSWAWSCAPVIPVMVGKEENPCRFLVYSNRHYPDSVRDPVSKMETTNVDARLLHACTYTYTYTRNTLSGGIIFTFVGESPERTCSYSYYKHLVAAPASKVSGSGTSEVPAHEQVTPRQVYHGIWSFLGDLMDEAGTCEDL